MAIDDDKHVTSEGKYEAMSENQQSGGGKMGPQQAVERLLGKIKELTEQLGSETRSRKAGEREFSSALSELTRQVEDLGRQVNRLTEVQFIHLALHMDLVRPMCDSTDPEVAAEAREQMNMALAQQAHIAPDLYESQYGISATTGEVLPGRQAGVPLH